MNKQEALEVAEEIIAELDGMVLALREEIENEMTGDEEGPTEVEVDEPGEPA